MTSRQLVKCLVVALEMAGFETVHRLSALKHLASRLPDLMLVD